MLSDYTIFRKQLTTTPFFFPTIQSLISSGIMQRSVSSEVRFVVRSAGKGNKSTLLHPLANANMSCLNTTPVKRPRRNYCAQI